MAYIRRMEAAASNLYKARKIAGFCHLYTGQEAVGTGIYAAMRKQDSVITSYRCHAWVYLMGDTVLSVLAELAGRAPGNVRGKGGSMHMYTRNFYGGNGIVGAQAPLGAGAAFAHKYLGDGGVNFALYGDGAANQGQIHEVFNIAFLWKLPICFMCENNKYGMGTSMNRSSASTEYYKRGDYIPGIWVNGMDLLTCREAARFIIDYCTSGKGPIVCEMETYRYFGHSMSDPGTSYRTREEVQKVRQTRDPINTFKEKILNAKLVTADELKKIDTKAKKDVDAATKEALAAPVIGVEELAADIYYHNIHQEIRGLIPNTPLKHLEITPRKK
ncbi:probable pyruvate dehydrogenase E1 component subunit alpha, mitochondrial [Pectinophora gossypiella]|uniref:probable pyruvate dehydrogenase E1 component subunit alpha, mitochondrial n=1 Tax=Pectinophora gossypiella TaxID=13191 RepID=UPI00214F4119|nr:probable pyruvate dehydrogenase E1 component subunit alpha, mitochondrial [Pectinophora gossypiella]